MAKSDSIEVEDSSHLTDADWAEINNLKRAYETGGQPAISSAMKELSDRDPIKYMSVIAAFFPEMVREAIRDSMAEIGMDENDVRELVRKLQSPARDQ